MGKDKDKDLDRLTSQLYSLPGIIGNLGCSVAEAQRRLNADYLHNVKELMHLIEGTLGSLIGSEDQALLVPLKAAVAEKQKALKNADELGKPQAGKELAEAQGALATEMERIATAAAAANQAKLQAFHILLRQLTPSRYQFTETTLEFSADLAEHVSRSFEGGVSAGVNVGMAAVTVNAALSTGYGRDYRAAARVSTVLHAYHDTELAMVLSSRAGLLGKLELPERTSVDQAVYDSAAQIFESMLGKDQSGADSSTSADNG